MDDPMEVSKTSVVSIPLRLDSNPLIDQTPRRILEREYELNYGTITLGTNDSIVSVFKPLDQQAIFDALVSFRYLRWKRIVYRVVSLTTPYVWGFVFGVILPTNGIRDPTLFDADYGYASHDNTVIMDIANQTEMEISVPWTFPQSWVDNFDGSMSAIMEYYYPLLLFSLDVLGGRVSTTASLDVPFKIYARLEGTEVAGPINATATTFKRQNPVQAQASLMASAAGYVAGEVVKKGSAKLFSSVESAVDQGIEYASDYVSQTMSGTGSGSTTTSSPIGVISNDSKGDGNVEVIPSIYGSMVYSDTRHVLASGSSMFPAKTNSIYEYMRVPSLLFIGTIGTDPFQFELNPFYSDRTTFQCSRIRMIGNMFRRWRGGIQYTILFPSSNFISFRVNVGMNFGTDPSYSAGDIPMKVISVHGTTKVSLFVPYLYPNLWMDTDASERMGTLTISIPSGQAPKTVGDVAPTCPFMIYESPGNDFQFSSLREMGPRYVASVEAQSTVVELMGSTPFAGSHPGSFQSIDEVDTFEGIMSRWSARTYGPVAHTRPNELVTAQQQAGGSTFDQLARIFLFWRGQLKYKLIFPAFDQEHVNSSVVISFNGNQGSESIYGIQDPFRFVDGTRVINLNDTQVLDFVVPFVCNTEWMPYYGAAPYVTSSAAPQVFDVSLNSFALADPTPTLLLSGISAGRDFVMKYSVPPPSTLHRWWD